MSQDCIFCKIAAKKIGDPPIYQDEHVTAFRDINPQTPTHILVIPNKHIASMNEVTEADEVLLGKLLRVAAQLAKENGVAESGYRLLINTGPDAGQAVFHLHVHILGGRRLGRMG